ncbi:MAG: DUF47 family protein [Candidatus Hydrogenedentota bacterium]
MKLNFLDLLVPRETKFFDMMCKQVSILLEGCNIFKNLVSSIEKLDNYEIKKLLMDIKKCEGKGDDVEFQIIDELHKTFVTPLDREDIHDIAINIDRALDILNSLSQKIETYSIKKVPKNVCSFTELIIEITSKLPELIEALKNKKNVNDIVKLMHELENKGDYLFHDSIAELFSENYTSIDIIKFKEVYELLEEMVDSVDYVGKICRGIMVKFG